MKKLIGAGGGQPMQRQNTNDNVFSQDAVKLVLAIGEGPIEGLKDGLKSFFVGDLPLVNANDPDIGSGDAGPYTIDMAPQALYKNQVNFTDLQVDLNTGAFDTEVYPMDDVVVNTNVGTRVTHGNPLLRITPAEVRGQVGRLQVRIKIDQLVYEDSSGTANTTGRFKVSYKKASLPDLTYQDILTPPATTSLYGAVTYNATAGCLEVTGKTTAGYVIEFDIPLPELVNDDWQIKITKVSPDYSGDPVFKDIFEMSFDSFQCFCMTQDHFLHPTYVSNQLRSHQNLAVIKISGKSTDQFSSLPDFYGIYRGLKIQVPIGYHPDQMGSAAYDYPTWNGTVDVKWTNNPVWILHDLIMNTRYGLRHHSPNVAINQADFYEASRYCDEPVETATGDIQKRYTFNGIISDNQNSKEVLHFLAGAFDAVLYDDGTGTYRLRVDKWADPHILITPECVTPQGFSYTFTDITTRYNDLTVVFTNPDKGWAEDRRRVYDQTLINRNGRIPLDFVAIGCTNEAEAYRRALWRMLTANTETIQVSFTTGRLGFILEPFDIVYLGDDNMGFGQATGRILETRGDLISLRDKIYFDSNLTIPDVNFQFKLKLQSYLGIIEYTVYPHGRDGQGFSRQMRILDTDLTGLQNVPEFAQFVLEPISGSELKAAPFRILGLQYDDATDTVQVTAAQVNADKYNNPLLITSKKRVIHLTHDRFNVNLREIYDEQGFALPAPGDSIKFIVDAPAFICSTSTTTPAMRTGTWPAGVELVLDVFGAVVGKGGKGGAGARLFDGQDWNPGVGGTGGPGFQTEYPITINVQSGGVFQGGEGGGGGGPVLLVNIDTAPGGSGTMFFVTGGSAGGGWPYGEAGDQAFFGLDTSAYSVVEVVGTIGLPGTKTNSGEGVQSHYTLTTPWGYPTPGTNHYDILKGKGGVGKGKPGVLGNPAGQLGVPPEVITATGLTPPLETRIVTAVQNWGYTGGNYSTAFSASYAVLFLLSTPGVGLTTAAAQPGALGQTLIDPYNLTLTLNFL